VGLLRASSSISDRVGGAPPASVPIGGRRRIAGRHLLAGKPAVDVRPHAIDRLRLRIWTGHRGTLLINTTAHRRKRFVEAGSASARTR
jgi:hypothetical protein